MNPMLEWWMQKMDFGANQNLMSTATRDSCIFPTAMEYRSLENMYLDRLEISNNDIHVSFAPSASDIIKRVISENVDDDTLVITTKSEHPNVVELMKDCKNILRISRDGKLNNGIDIGYHIRKYKRVFVYLIGLSMGNDYRTPDYLIQSIRSLSAGKEVVSVLDAVQEMFILPRDYEKYDYVIGTAHALIPGFNLGIVLSREYFQKDTQNGYDFLRLLDLMLTKKEYILLFNYVMSECFSRYTMTDENLHKTSNCPHIFTLEDEMDRLWGIQEIIGRQPNHSLVTFRACNDFLNREKFRRKLSLIENSLG